jgi:hypothetical protein
MLVIRKEQIEVMEGAASGSFEENLVTHMKTVARRHTDVIGDDGARAIVKNGIDRAQVYGLTKRGPVRFFVEMIFLFGSEFDTDPLLPWASGVLTNPSIHDQMERADILHEAMTEYVDRVAGKEKEFLLASMRRFNKSRLEDYQTQGTSFDAAIKEMLRANFPERCEFIGDEGMAKLIESGKEEARSRSIKSAKGAALLTVLMFQLGHAATRDPLFPWISEALNDESVSDPNERIKNLRAKAVKYSEKTLEHLEQDTTNGIS